MRCKGETRPGQPHRPLVLGWTALSATLGGKMGVVADLKRRSWRGTTVRIGLDTSKSVFSAWR